MKVVFINIADISGGASIVANRLRLYLVSKSGVEDFYFVADKKLDDPRVIATRNTIGWFFERIIDKVFNKIGLQYQWFPFSSRVMLQEIRRLQPDIISLHVTHGGFFQTNILPRLSQIAPVVWTLHDMWAFTGNSAHTFGNESWKKMRNDSFLTRVQPTIGVNTGGWLLRQKQKIYQRTDLTVVTPSQWLLDLARQSPVFSGKEMFHIFNGIDMTVFIPMGKPNSRASLGIPDGASTIMFSAGALVNNMWKGGEHLYQVLNLINSLVSVPVHLIVVGSGGLVGLSSFLNFVVHQVGYVHSEKEMARYFSASDVFIYPTKADTLPTVLIEASACGTPCVTFNIGGAAEIVMNDVTGVVVEPFRLDEMAVAVVDLLVNTEKRQLMSGRARAYMESEFSIEIMAQRYMEIFGKVVKKEKPTRYLHGKINYK